MRGDGVQAGGRGETTLLYHFRGGFFQYFRRVYRDFPCFTHPPPPPVFLVLPIWVSQNLDRNAMHPVVGVHIPHCRPRWDKRGNTVERGHVFHITNHLPKSSFTTPRSFPPFPHFSGSHSPFTASPTPRDPPEPPFSIISGAVFSIFLQNSHKFHRFIHWPPFPNFPATVQYCLPYCWACRWPHLRNESVPDLPLASAGPDVIRWSRVLPRLRAGRSTSLLSSGGAEGGYC